MNLDQILLGGVPQREQGSMIGQQQPQSQAPTQPNPFAGLLNVGKLMQENPDQVQAKIREMSMKGIRPPDFTPDTFLSYVQNSQSARNGAVQNAGQGIPAQGSAPIMPMPQSRGM